MNNEQKLKELQEQYDKLGEKIKALKEAGNGKRWKPEYGDQHWSIDANGDVDVAYWGEDEYDQWRYNEKNVFRTREQAKAVREAKQAIYELVGDYEPDWGDGKAVKWCVLYSVEIECMETSYSYVYPDYKQIYFPDEQTAEKAIPHFQVLYDNGAF